MIVGSFRNNDDRLLSISLLQKGALISVYNRGVCAIWLNADDPRALASMCRVKGGVRLKQPLSVTFPSDTVCRMVDRDRIGREFRPIFLDPSELSERLGSLSFIRVPITTKAARELPESVISFSMDGLPVIQNWDPIGHLPAEQLVSSIISRGIEHPAITSLNLSGQPEIVDQDEGMAFCQSYGISCFLKDPEQGCIVRGSFPIISFENESAQVIRMGHFDSDLFKNLLDAPVDVKSAKNPQFPLLKINTEQKSAKRLRLEIIKHLNGINI